MNIQSKINIVLIFIILLFINTNTLAVTKHETIPAHFQGTWVSDLKQCHRKTPGQIKITSEKIEFWESSGSVVSVVTRNDIELAVIIKLTGEGENWLSFSHFRLSADKLQLTDISEPYSTELFVSYRCPEQ